LTKLVPKFGASFFWNTVYKLCIWRCDQWRRRFHTDLGPLQGSSSPVDFSAGEGETQLS